jgi:HPt (histidine-containing phosphotransfer) domain-containing protein
MDLKMNLIVKNVIQKRFRGKIEYYKEMTDLFFDTVDDDLEDIQEAITSQNFEKIKIPAHYLKGSANTLGAKDIADIADQMEHLSAFDPNNNVELLYNRLLGALRSFRDFTNQLN